MRVWSSYRAILAASRDAWKPHARATPHQIYHPTTLGCGYTLGRLVSHFLSAPEVRPQIIRNRSTCSQSATTARQRA